MRKALFDTYHHMKTFDVSVNVLNSNVLSDRLLWKERTLAHLLPAAERAVEINVVPRDTPTSVCDLRTPEIPLEMSLLTLPLTFLMVFIVLWQEGDRAHVPMVDTLVACALVLATPAVLLVWRQRSFSKHVYVHILLLHEASLLVILQPSALFILCIVFAVIFGHLSYQNPGRRVLYLFVVLCNVATVPLLLYSTSLEKNTEFSRHVVGACVVLCSACVYAVYVIVKHN